MLAILQHYAKTSAKSQWCGFIIIHTQIGGKSFGLLRSGALKGWNLRRFNRKIKDK